MSVPTGESGLDSLLAGERLTEVIPWAHRFLETVLRPGDLAVDLTAGAGRDTLFLFRCVSPTGRVLAFDVQEIALRRTRARLEEAGASVHLASDDPPASGGVYLFRECHSRVGRFLDAPPRAVIANLGYLPGSDGMVRTEAASTVAAIDAAVVHLVSGGRIAVVVYPGHPGGEQEGMAVEERFRRLAPKHWQVLRLEAANRSRAPFVLLAQKR